jgi:hypothetical protein
MQFTDQEAAMKRTQSLLNSLVACGVALAMVSTLAAQTVNQEVAKVIRLKGAARYTTGNNNWQRLKVGDVVKPGTIIQTAAKSHVDLALGGGAAPSSPPATVEMLSYRPSAEQNVVRIWENSLLGIDKLTSTRTGADVVTETQLDLKAGHIFGVVKKLSAASKYEVKIPNGVAGIRGTVYDISAEGVVKVYAGSVVLAYVGPSGSVVTQVVMPLQMFDARTGALSPLPDLDKKGMGLLLKQVPSVLTPTVTPIMPDKSLYYISPH